MNWEEWLKYPLYKKLWSLIGGRPWTYIYRDVWHEIEIAMQMQWFWTAILAMWLLGVSIPLKEVLVYCAVYLFGFINGHLFWGTVYVHDQPGD